MKKANVLLIVAIILASGVAWYFWSKIGINQQDVFSNINMIGNNWSNNVDWWLTFMSILCTLFAVFFVYSWFKIDWTVEKIEESQKRIIKLEDDVKDDVEFSNQLRYAISFLFSKQYNKAIDALIVLRSEPFVLKNDDRLNTCYFLLAHSYYEQWCQNKEIEGVAKAVEFINLAIEDVNHPVRQEFIQKFEEMMKKEKTNKKNK